MKSPALLPSPRCVPQTVVYRSGTGNLRTFLALLSRNRGCLGDSIMERQGRGASHSERMRCDHCRKSFGLILYRYFRMRFCSADCLDAYQRRLDELTMIKIQHLDTSRVFPN
jgi:hypothetical protein